MGEDRANEATNDGANANPTELPVTLVEGGAFSSHVEKQGFRIVRCEQAFHALYSRRHSGRIPPKQPPSVDFQKYLVLVAFMGAKTSTGHSISFKETAAIADGTLRIAVGEQHPSPGNLVGMAMTSPYAIAKVTRGSYGSVAFVNNDGQVLARMEVPNVSRR